MITLDSILRDLKSVPAERLEDVHSFIKSLSIDKGESNVNRTKILSFAGSFTDMDEQVYKDFVSETINTRRSLFDRDINL